MATQKNSETDTENTTVRPYQTQAENKLDSQSSIEVRSPRGFIDREQKQIALEESEVRYRRLFETAKDGILILDGDTGRITDVNPFLQDMLGYSKEMVYRRLRRFERDH